MSRLGAEDKRPSQMGKEPLVDRPAIGVVAAIGPWNFPVTLAMSKIAPAMAAGCTLVIKPSPGTVLASYIVAMRIPVAAVAHAGRRADRPLVGVHLSSETDRIWGA